MAEVNFSDEVAAATWLKSQSVEMQCAIGSRAALRVCANLGQLEGDSFEHVALPSFRATLTTAVRGLGRPADVDWLERTSSVSSAAAFSSARNIFSLSDADPSIATGASAAAFSSAFAASAAMASAFSSSSSSSADATSFDASKEDLTEYRAALWAGAEVPPAIEAAHRAFLIKLEADRSTWGFWHDWYLAMWEGRFKDWDLATAVSKIPDDVWEDGAEAVAFEIKQTKPSSILKARLKP